MQQGKQRTYWCPAQTLQASKGRRAVEGMDQSTGRMQTVGALRGRSPHFQAGISSDMRCSEPGEQGSASRAALTAGTTLPGALWVLSSCQMRT